MSKIFIYISWLVYIQGFFFFKKHQMLGNFTLNSSFNLIFL